MYKNCYRQLKPALPLLCLMLLAFTSNSSVIAQNNISLQLRGATLKEALNKLQEQSQLNLTYADKVIGAKAKKITISADKQPFNVVLSRILQNTGLSYRQESNNIIIYEIPVKPKRTISGTVTDSATNETLPGVSIQAQTSKGGTTTDLNGKFSLQVEEGESITIRIIGYQDKIISNPTAGMTIVMSSSTSALNEVVVVGYGTQKKVNLTGAVSVVKAEDISGRPLTAVSTGLQGQVPGLTAVSQRGQPGASNAELRIRGVGTTNDSGPFILIDGIPGDLNWINPSDIESVSVLKDAASSAIYGSRAANGVILVTTKNGKFNQKPVISYTGYFGTQLPTALPKMLGSVEYMQFLSEAQTNAGLALSYTEEQIQKARDGSDPNYFANTNWPKALIKSSAPQQEHNISVSGGGSDMNYYFSYNYQDQKGLIVGDQYRFLKNNARLKLSSKNILDIIDVDANLGYLDRNQQQPANATDNDAGTIYTMFTMSPLTPVRFTNGGWGYGGGSSNPVTIATDGGFNNFVSKEFTANITGTVHILKNLDVRAQYGTNISNQKRALFNRRMDYFYPESGVLWYTNNANNQLQNVDFVRTLQNLSAQVNYNFNIEKHHVKTITGYNQETFRYDSFSASKTNFVSDDVPVLNLGSANPIVGGDAYQYALQSLFGRINYDYADKYLFEFNLRYDGSSRYQAGRRFGTYPSASVGWRFTQENFLKNSSSKWLSEGKIRASYGLLGNQFGADGPGFAEWYPYIPVIQNVSTMPIGNILTNGFAQTILANPLLRWESVDMLNFGLDLAFLNNRLGFTGDWFDKRTRDVQLKVPQPDVIGLTVADQNAGDISNRGWELALTWNDKIRTFTYGASIFLSDVKNKVINLGGAPPTLNDRIRQVGFPIDAFYGYRTDGLAQAGDFSTNPAGKPVPNFPIFAEDAGKVAPGDVRYRDLNGDGKITADLDRTVIGNAYPRYNYSFRLNAGYKGFDVNVFVQGVGKGNGYISGPGIHAYNADAAFPQEIHRDHWTPQNTDAKYPRFVYKDTRNTDRLSDYWLQDASYLRLKNVQLGYTFPVKWTQKLHIDQLRIYGSADNLFTATNYFYAFDPETITSRGGLYPQVKTIIFGVNLRLK